MLGIVPRECDLRMPGKLRKRVQMTMRPQIPVAREIMITKLVTLRPQMSVAEAIKVLLRHTISGAPVVGEDGALLGMFSEFDCLRALANREFHSERDESRLVGDLMTRDGHTIPPELDLFRIAQAFVDLHVRRLPVMEEGRLIGQLSRRDVLRSLDKMGADQAGQRSYPDYPKGREPLG